jgi:hypothetical protein
MSRPYLFEQTVSQTSTKPSSKQERPEGNTTIDPILFVVVLLLAADVDDNNNNESKKEKIDVRSRWWPNGRRGRPWRRNQPPAQR